MYERLFHQLSKRERGDTDEMAPQEVGLKLSDSHGIDCHYAEEGLVAVLDGNQAIRLDVPVGGSSRLKASAVVLKYDASNRIFELLT